MEEVAVYQGNTKRSKNRGLSPILPLFYFRAVDSLVISKKPHRFGDGTLRATQGENQKTVVCPLLFLSPVIPALLFLLLFT